MPEPPRPRSTAVAPDTPAPAADLVEVDVPVTGPPPARLPAPIAQLDESTRNRVAAVIARALAAELGEVRISSVPPPSDAPPRSSMRAAADGTLTVGKWSVFASGAISLLGTIIALCFRPEYAAPLGQALKLILSVILAATGGSTPAK